MGSGHHGMSILLFCNGNLPKWRVVSVRPLAIEVSLIPSDTGLVVLWIKGPVNPYCLGIAQPFFV